LTALKQATYLGGSRDDGATSLAIAPATGDVYIAGFTDSVDLPGTAGGAQSNRATGTFDGFVARLSADLTALVQSTYLGGGSSDAVTSLAIAPATGEVYVAGTTFSADFPGTGGGAQDALAGIGDAFAARLNAGLTALDQATYLGGGGTDAGTAVAIAATGDVYVAGLAGSLDFPGTSGGAQSAPGDPAGSDAFVAWLNPSLTVLGQATYPGGNALDGALALALSATTGDIYVAGDTNSADFPGTDGGAQSAPGAGIGFDGFVARLDRSLTALEQATYLGGSDGDVALALAIAPTNDEIYVAGETDSADF